MFCLEVQGDVQDKQILKYALVREYSIIDFVCVSVSCIDAVGSFCVQKEGKVNKVERHQGIKNRIA